MSFLTIRLLAWVGTWDVVSVHPPHIYDSGIQHEPTAFVERVNLTIRPHVAAVGRRVSTLCEGQEGLRQPLALYQTYSNFCLPHGSLRQALPQPEPTKGTGAAKMGPPWTPAMAAGLTNHVWSRREGLRYRVPPWPQPQTV